MTDELLKGLYKFCDEKSKNIKLKAEPQVFVELCNALEELKELRKFKDWFYDLGKLYSEIRQEERNKAIDDAINEIVSVRSEVAEKEPYDDHLFTVLVQRQNEIVDLIQKLKVGGNDGC